jgi:penicillin G amidase
VSPAPFPADSATLRRKVPPKDAALVGAVGDEVTVRWDTWGIAHVRAERHPDLAYGLGYATAQECLWRLDYCRRLARGELAAVLGPDALASDVLMRRLGLGRHADTLAAALPPALGDVLAALAAGINRWIEQATAERRLALEFDWLDYAPAPWTPADTIAVWKQRWWTLTGRLENLALGEAARRYLPPELLGAFMATELGEETIVQGPPPHATRRESPVPGGADTGEGSNNWAVDGSRTTTGAPVLCSDPHNPFGQPGQWFQAQLTLADGSLDVAGAVYAGTPGVYFGRTRGLAWGFTNHVASVRDLYLERVDPARPGGYLEGATWRPFDVERVRVAVRGGPDETLEVRRTSRGPLVDDLLPSLGPADEPGGAPISLRWLGVEVGTGFDALLALNAASSVPEGLIALADWACPVANALLADTAGHIAYHAIGRVPRRATATRAYRDAGDGADAWQGFIPYESMPQRIDPPEGWLATANQPPWPADPPGLPYLGSAAWADGWRMRRIKGRLLGRGGSDRPRLSPEEVAAIQADTVGGRAGELAPVVARLLGEGPASDAGRRVAAALAGWDGDHGLESVAPAVWAAFWDHWLRRVAEARFPGHLVPLVAGQAGAIARDLLLGRDTTPPWLGGADLRLEVERTAGAALAWLRDRLGADGAGLPAWGAVHTVTWHHPLSQLGPPAQRAAAAAAFDVGPFPTTGGAGTVRSAGYGMAHPFRVTGGATYRLVADLSPGGGLRATTTTGQSGHPGSPHYADQAPLWLGDSYHSFPLDDFQPEGVTTIRPLPAAPGRTGGDG